MTLVEKGKFCSSCQKKVFDFTKASDKEIIETLQQEKSTCGRFLSSQLNRNLVTTQQKSSYWLLVSASLLSLLGIGNQSSYAQVKNDMIQVEPKYNNKVKDSINPNLLHKIKGVVSDDLGTLPGATVTVKGTKTTTLTDFDGKFEIDAKIGDTLEFTYSSDRIEHQIIDSKDLNIILNSIIIGGESIVIVGGIKRKTFFGRIFHTIRNLFR